MPPVSRLELLQLLDDAHWASAEFPGISLMRDRAVDVITRALIDRSSIEAHEIDAIVVAARETADHRARFQLGDPYVEQRARCIDILTRLKAELDEPPPFHEQIPEMSHAGRGAALGVRIRAARRHAALTQAQLAHKLEVNQTTVARWEAGVLAPSHRHRWRLADLLGGRPADYEE